MLEKIKKVLELLNQKNHFLEKFYSLNEQELPRFLSGDFAGLERFYESRERILEIIKYIDSQIELQKIDDQSLTPSYKKELAKSLNIKDEYVRRILELDLQILSSIESAKNSIISELRELERGRKVVRNYKSPEFTRRLDEEA